jgi:hypothetical protein
MCDEVGNDRRPLMLRPPSKLAYVEGDCKSETHTVRVVDISNSRINGKAVDECLEVWKLLLIVDRALRNNRGFSCGGIKKDSGGDTCIG